MKIGILFNCQGRGIAASLQAMLPDAEVQYFSLWECRHEEKRAAAAAYCSQCTHVFTSGAGKTFGPLVTENLRQEVENVHVLPVFNFRGFHPDQFEILLGESPLVGPTGPYQSRIAVAGYLAGLTPEDTVALYHRLVFVRLGYDRIYEQEFVLLGESFARLGLDASPLFAQLRMGGCFMHSWNHPKRLPLHELARIACGLIGGSLVVDVAVDSVPDLLEQFPTHPAFDDIASLIGVAPDGMFHNGHPQELEPRPIELLEFVASSFAAFEGTSRAVLRQADGVAAAMRELGLAELSPVRRRVQNSAELALLTVHGTLLRTAPSGAALHLAVTVSDSEVSLLRADLRHGRVDGMPPLQIREGARPNTLAFERDGLYLGTERSLPEAFYLRDAAGDAESFIPVTNDQIAVLQDLLAGQWAKDGSAESLQASMSAGPSVMFGSSRIDLAPAWPCRLPPVQGGAARLAVWLDGAPAVLRQTVGPARAAAPLPKIALGRRIVLAGNNVLLPPPLMLTNKERRWLHENYGSAGGLPWQAEAPRVILGREENQRLLGSPPLPEEMVNPDAVLDGMMVLVAPQGGSQDDLWMAPLLRLLVMAPFLETGARVIAPGNDRLSRALGEAWQWLGLPPIDIVMPPTGLYVARDVVWMDTPSPSGWAAETLRSVRSVSARGAADDSARFFLRGHAARAIANQDELVAALSGLGFTTIDMFDAAPAAQLPLLRNAGWLIGVGDDLLAAAFCPAGAKIIELSGAAAFDPTSWLLSCRLGMNHAVLPCDPVAAGFAADTGRLAQLVKVMAYRN